MHIKVSKTPFFIYIYFVEMYTYIITLSQMFPTILKPREILNFFEVTVGLIWSPVDDVISLSPLLLPVLLGRNGKNLMIPESEEGNL